MERLRLHAKCSKSKKNRNPTGCNAAVRPIARDTSSTIYGTKERYWPHAKCSKSKKKSKLVSSMTGRNAAVRPIARGTSSTIYGTMQRLRLHAKCSKSQKKSNLSARRARLPRGRATYRSRYPPYLWNHAANVERTIDERTHSVTPCLQADLRNVRDRSSGLDLIERDPTIRGSGTVVATEAPFGTRSIQVASVQLRGRPFPRSRTGDPNDRH